MLVVPFMYRFVFLSDAGSRPTIIYVLCYSFLVQQGFKSKNHTYDLHSFAGLVQYVEAESQPWLLG